MLMNVYRGKIRHRLCQFILHIVYCKLEGNLGCCIVEQIADNYLVVLVN